MTQAERDRLVALKKAKKKLITQKQAAEELYAYGEPRESAVVGGPACGSEVGKLTEGKAVQSRKYRSQILLY